MCDILIKSGEPCSHPGCLSHVSHPCEGCLRIAGLGHVLKNPFIYSNESPATNKSSNENINLR